MHLCHLTPFGPIFVFPPLGVAAVGAPRGAAVAPRGPAPPRGGAWPRAERGLLDADDAPPRGRSVVVARGKKDPRLKPAGRDQDVVVATPPARNNLILII